jgi:hypothetical protein
MRATAIVLCCAAGLLAAGCGGGSSTGGHPDAAADVATGSDGAGGRDAGADAARDAARDGTATGGDARDATAGGDAARDVGADVAADTAADAPADVPADMAPGSDGGGDAGADAGPALVTVQFTGTVQTVAPSPGQDGSAPGVPLGLGVARLASVSGSFTYDLRVPESTSTRSDPTRAIFLHSGTSQFTFTVGGHTVTGSGDAIVEVENLNPDTFRFRDGQQNDGVTRTMKVDGVADPSLVLFFAVTDESEAGGVLTSDAEPDPFLFPASDPLTFSLSDSGGSLLMQLDSLVMQ